MTITALDLFCGAGGSSLGAERAGVKLTYAANHWARAIEVHQSHFPDEGHQSLLMPYYGKGVPQPTDEPVPTVPTRDRFALIDTDRLVDDCGFRMLEPYEIAAAMDFPVGYIPRDLPKKDQVKLAGNAVTASVMETIMRRVTEALAS